MTAEAAPRPDDGREPPREDGYGPALPRYGGSAGPSDRAAERLGIVLSGGGARGAYQVGVLRYLGRRLGDYRPSILTGVSAGAINTGFLASHLGDLDAATRDLKEKWTELRTRDVMQSDPLTMGFIVLRWLATLASGGSRLAPRARSLVDNRPLERYLSGLVDPERIRKNVENDRLRAAAVTATSYQTGRTVTFVQGEEDLRMWRRPQREARREQLTLDHVLASAAIPLLFPAVRLGDGHYGDGSVRQTAPLAPAIHLGARRILAVSSRYPRDVEEARRPSVEGYPPIAQIGGVLANSSFLDTLETDARWLRRVNRLVSKIPEEERRRERLEEIDLLVLRPSRDLGRLAAEYERELPRTLRFLTRGLGSRESDSPDLVSYLLFERGYLRHLIELGERDAERQWPRLASFLGVDEGAGEAGPAGADRQESGAGTEERQG